MLRTTRLDPLSMELWAISLKTKNQTTIFKLLPSKNLNPLYLILRLRQPKRKQKQGQELMREQKLRCNCKLSPRLVLRLGLRPQLRLEPKMLRFKLNKM